MAALNKALTDGARIVEVFNAIKRTGYNAEARKSFATSRDILANGLKRKSWEGECTKAFTAAFDRTRYGIQVLTAGDDALKYVHEKGIECDFNGRNRYGKQLSAIDLILGKKAVAYEQSAYMTRTVAMLTEGDEIESTFTVNARELAYSIGAAKDKPIGQTQVYAVMHALELIGAGKRVMAGKGSEWLASKIMLNAESDFVQALNKRIA